MLVSFENSKSDAFLKDSEKNDKRKENRQKSSYWKENIYDAKMKGDTHFGKDENLPLRYAYFHVH